MAFGRLMTRVLSGAIFLAAGVVASMHFQDISRFYRDIYPTDPVKREALDLCFTQNHQFNRLDPVARASCYSHALLPAAAMAGLAPIGGPAANPIDLQRDAAAGHMPRNDIRRTQETREVLHLTR
jgi:hypothetical protein